MIHLLFDITIQIRVVGSQLRHDAALESIKSKHETIGTDNAPRGCRGDGKNMILLD